MSPEAPAPRGLRRDCLSFWEVVAQSVANISPSATPALVVPLVFASTANGTWLAYVFSTLALLLVTYHINQFARRSASPGSLYTFVAHGLGPTWGVISGWSLVIAYLIIGGSVLAGLANYVEVLAHAAVGSRFDQILAPGSMAIAGLAAWYVAYRDIKLSTQFMLILEFASVTLILILAAAFFVKSAKVVDLSQLRLSGVSAAGLRQGLVLAIFSYVGFESATALGHEARDPLRSIPRSVLFTVCAVGALFVFMSYTLVLAFHGQKASLGVSTAPLSVLATLAGIPAFGLLIAGGVAISFFACALACVNAGARVLFAMSRHGLFHSSAGDAHTAHSTPHVGVTVAALVVFAAPAALLFNNVPLLDIFGYLGTIGTFGILVCYVLVSIAAPLYLRRRGELNPTAAAAGVLAVGALIIPIVGSVYPVPATPYNDLPYVFLGLLALGTARFVYLRLFEPAVIATIEADLLAQTLAVAAPAAAPTRPA
ncbi:MAG: APC family permease [Candidatus Eremiobacteraeota bacterium]|nr:APC family permease [Candidatus Eremiobacteraeota bacterium]